MFLKLLRGTGGLSSRISNPEKSKFREGLFGGLIVAYRILVAGLSVRISP